MRTRSPGSSLVSPVRTRTVACSSDSRSTSSVSSTIVLSRAVKIAPKPGER